MKRLVLLLVLTGLGLGVFWLLRAPTRIHGNREKGARIVEDTEKHLVTVTGMLVDQDSTPVAHHEVWLAEADSFSVVYSQPDMPGQMIATVGTDASGHFAFTGVTPGSWWIGPVAERTSAIPGGLAGLPVRVDVTEGALDVDVLVRAHRELAVAGKVLDPDGRPVEGVYVCVNGGLIADSMFTDANGAFELGPLEPGRCSVSALRLGEPFHPLTDFLEVEAGKRDVVLRIQEATTSLRGHVTGASGEPAHGRVLLTNPEGLHAYHTFDNGSFAFGALEPGFYSVAVSTDDQVAVAKDVLVRLVGTRDEVFLKLEPAARIRVSIGERESARCVGVLFDGALVAFEWIEPNAQATLVVPVGPITVGLRVRGGSPSGRHDVVTRAGQELELMFD